MNAASGLSIQAIAELSPVGMVELSKDGTIQLVNSVGAELLHLLPHELLHSRFSNLVASTDLKVFENFLESVFSSCSNCRCELDLLCGNCVPLRVRLEARVTDTSRCLLALIDLSQYRDVESRIHQSEARFRNLLDSLPNIAVQGYDANRKIFFWNAASEELYGYTAEEAIGQKLDDLIIPDALQDRTERVVGNWLDSGVGIPASELVLKDKKGQPVTVFSSHCLQYNCQGQAEMFCLDIDLREQKRLEEQLRHSQKMEAIGQLAGGVAHDFNNILTVILGYCSLLKNKIGDDHERRADLEQISGCAHRAANLTRSLLAFSRRSPVNLQPRDVNQVVSGIEPFLQRLLGEDLVLEVACEPFPLPINADQGQLEQVLVNLATNARDAMPKGGRLKITTQRRDDQAAILVEDTGNGMNEATQKRLFEPFYTTKPPGKGTGLGLAIVYSIIKQHEGTIEVDSKPHLGSQFMIKLPLTDSQQAHNNSPTSFGSPSGSATILVVEDEIAVGKVIREILQRNGYRVISANNGVEGVAKFIEHCNEIDLVLMDVVMPGINGPEAADQIRQQAPSTKVLFMSGYTFEVLRDRSGFSDQHEVLSKPIETTYLLEKVQSMLESTNALSKT